MIVTPERYVDEILSLSELKHEGFHRFTFMTFDGEVNFKTPIIISYEESKEELEIVSRHMENLHKELLLFRRVKNIQDVELVKSQLKKAKELINELELT